LCPRGLTGGERLTALGEQTLEAGDIELLRLDRKQVATTTGQEPLASDRLAEVRDEDADAVEGARRWMLSPERFGHTICRDDLACVEKEECEQRLLLSPANVE
jgi:hypothetical protein